MNEEIEKLQNQIKELETQIEGLRYELFKKIGSSSNSIENSQITTQGIGNVGVGANALKNNSASYNTAVGGSALSLLKTNNGNVAVGYEAGKNHTGQTGTFIGAYAGQDNTTGNTNTFVGYIAGANNTTGLSNAAFGALALNASITGDYNTAMGKSAGNNLSAGSNNIFLGYSAGAYETGSNAFYVDSRDRGTSSDDKTKAILYGVMASAVADQKLTINGLLNQSVSKTPASATATGTTGDIAWDASYIYICTATDTWKRVAISTW